MKDSSRTLATADREVGAAVDTAVATFLDRARNAVLGTNLSADASPSDLPPDLDRWPSSSVWEELVRRFIQPAIGAAFDAAFDVAARTDLLEQHRYRQTYMDQVHDRLSDSLWPDQAFEQVRGDLAEGLDAGESIPQLRERVGAALGVDRHSYQAERIARTEAHTATEGGAWSAEMSWQEATGEQLYHLWDAALDRRTRPEHANAHNQIRPISDPFDVGGYRLMFPGDPAGPAHLVVNCRCTRLTGTEDELRDLAGLSPNEPPVETPQERVERILAEAVDGEEALGRVVSATDLQTTQQQAFVRYTGSAYRNMNRAARQRAFAYAPQAINNREGRNPTDTEIQEWERLTGQAPTADELVKVGVYDQHHLDLGTPRQDAETFAEMSKGFASGEPIREPVKLYRGVNNLSHLMGRDTDLIGMEFGDAAVVSSSADLDVAKGFSMGGPILEVLADAGTPAVNVTPISEYEQEQEVIFPQGTRFRVVADETRDDGRRYVQVEPVGAPGWRPTPRQKTTTAAAAAASPSLTPCEQPDSSMTRTTWSSSPTIPSAPTPTTAGAGTAPTSPGGPMTDVVETTQPTPHAPERLFWRAAMVPLDSLADYRVITSPKDEVVLTTDLMWLKWQEQDSHGHDGSVTVGRIDRVWVQDGWLWGEGEWDLADRTGNTAEVIRKVQDRFAGTISVDLRDGFAEEVVVDAEGSIVDFDSLLDTEDIDDLVAAFDRGQYKFLERVHDWRLEGCTLVQSPAYYTSRLWVLEEDALTAAITGNQDLPLADRDTEWDGAEALRSLQDADALADGCFWRDPDTDAGSNVQGDYKLPFATVIDGTITAIPAGIFAVASVLQGGMGGVDIPEADADRIRSRVEAWYERMSAEFDDPDLIAPWVRDAQEETVTADAAPTRQEVAVITAAAGVATETSTWAEQVATNIPLEPPAEWFTRPDLSGPTKVRVLDSGRVYGHLATWDTEHVGMPGHSITPPRSATGYAHFQRNRIRCADGTTVWAGTLVMGTGHADTRVSSSAAMNHYDDTGYAVADIVCGEDEIGIWFSGALKPGASPLQILTLDRYSLSGDWRGGELIGACVVNVPGFPIAENELSLVAAATGGAGTLPTARLQARRQGTEMVALVASGVLAPTRTSKRGSGPTMADLHQRLNKLPDQVYSATLRARREEREFAALAQEMQADEMAALAARMKQGL